MPVPDEHMHRYTVCVTRTGRKKHWGYPISDRHPLARRGAPVRTLAIGCQAPLYTAAAEPLSPGDDREGCTWCSELIHPFP